MVGIYWESSKINACDATLIRWGNGTAPYTVTLVSRAGTQDMLYTTIVLGQPEGSLEWKVPETNYLGRTLYFKARDAVSTTYSQPIFFYGGVDQNGDLVCTASTSGTSPNSTNGTDIVTTATNNTMGNDTAIVNNTMAGNGTLSGNQTWNSNGTWTGNQTYPGDETWTGNETYPTSDAPARSWSSNSGRIAGIAVGIIVGLALFALGAWLVRRRKRPVNAERMFIDEGDNFDGRPAPTVTPYSTFVSDKPILPPRLPPRPASEPLDAGPISAATNPFSDAHEPQGYAELAEKRATLAQLDTKAILSAATSSRSSLSPALLTPVTPLSAAPTMTQRAPAPLTRRPPPRPVEVAPATDNVPLHDVDAGRMPELPPMYDPAWKNESSGSGAV